MASKSSLRRKELNKRLNDKLKVPIKKEELFTPDPYMSTCLFSKEIIIPQSGSLSTFPGLYLKVNGLILVYKTSNDSNLSLTDGSNNIVLLVPNSSSIPQVYTYSFPNFIIFKDLINYTHALSPSGGSGSDFYLGVTGFFTNSIN